MSGLQDYLMSTSSLADFMPEEATGSLGNQRTRKNIAANVAALSPDPITTYESINLELQVNPRSQTHNAITSTIQAENKAKDDQFFMDLLADPNVSDEEKAMMAEAISNPAFRQPSEHDTLSERMLEIDDGTESNEAFVTREQVLADFRERNLYRQEVQKVLNSLTTFKDQGLMSQAADIGEMLVPFIDQGLFESIISDMEDAGVALDQETKRSILKGDNAFLLLGSTKRQLAEAFQRMPVQLRMEAIEKVVDIVKNNDSALMDSNTLYLADYLQTILLDGSYRTGDVWIDNVIGILDVVGLAGGMKAAVRAGRLSKARKGAAAFEVLEDADDVVFPQDKTTPAAKRRPEDIELDSRFDDIHYEDVKTRTVQTEVIPTSPSENINATNTGRGRELYDTVLEDEIGEFTDAISGTTRSDYIANSNLPQVRKANGGVDYKLPTPTYNYDVKSLGPNPREGYASTWERGYMHYTPEEKAARRSAVFLDLNAVKGMIPRPNMGSFKERTDGLDASVVYGPLDNGFANANDAVDTIKHELRNYGITEDQITVLKNGPKGYEPVPIEPKMPVGDYLVQVDYSDRFRAGMKDRDGNPIIGERLEKGIGSSVSAVFEKVPQVAFLKEVFVTPEILIPERTIGSFATGFDQAVQIERSLIELVKPFNKKFSSLKKVEQKKFVKAIDEANDLSIPYTRSWAQGKHGLSNKSYDLLMEWKNIWDQIYWLENRDFIRHLRRGDFKVWSDGKDTTLLAKPLSRKAASDIKQSAIVLDPHSGIINRLTENDLKTLYNNGGTIAQLRSGIDEGGELVEYIISREQRDFGYLREIADNEQILNYRDGYYQKSYNDPFFIIEVDGLKTKAVQTAPDIKSAELAVRKLAKEYPERTFKRRRAKETGVREGDSFSNEDALFDVAVASGRSSQKYRGKGVKSVTTVPYTNLHDPLDVLQKAVRSVSGRAALGEVFDAHKQRLVNAYSDYMPVDKYGRPNYPTRLSQIKDRHTGELSDGARRARSLYRYISNMEDMAPSLIGDITNSLFTVMADDVGLKVKVRGGTELESMFRSAAKVDPVSASTALAHKMLVLWNPLAQVITQAAGMVNALGTNPTYFFRPGGAMAQLPAFLMHKAGYLVPDDMLKVMDLSRSEWDELMARLDESGLIHAADVNNMVRSSNSYMRDTSWDWMRNSKSSVYSAPTGIHAVTQKAGKVISTTARRTSRAAAFGFDLGETINMVTAYLSQADLARKEGKLNNAEDYQFVAYNARKITLGMNKAGQLWYQKGLAKIPFQFFQVAHKQLMLYGSIPWKQSATLATAMLVMFGGKAAPMLEEAFDHLMVDSSLSETSWETYQLIKRGFIEWGFNKLLSSLSGEEQNIAFADRLSPLDYQGAGDFVASIITNPVSIETWKNTPAASVYGNMWGSMRSLVEVMGLTDDQLPSNEQEFMSFVRSVGMNFTAYSNTFKAKMALRYSKAFSKKGMVTDPSITSAEGIAKIFGFQTIDEARSFDLNTQLYGTSRREAAEWDSAPDVKQWYEDAKAKLFRSEMDPSTLEATLKVFAAAAGPLFDNNPVNLSHLSGLIERDAALGEHTFVNGLLKRAGLGMDSLTFKKMVNEAPNLTREERADLIEFINSIDKGE